MKRALMLGTALGLTAALSALALGAAPSVAAGSLPALTLALTKNTVTVGGSEVSGAVDVVSTVSGEASDGPTLIELKPGVTPAQLAHVAQSIGDGPLDAIDPYATIVFAGSAVKGSPTSAQVSLAPGNYVAVNNGNGFTPFTVTASARPAALPAPGATITAIDFGFRGATTLHDGELVRFRNAGYLVHMVGFAQVRSAADARKAEAALLAGKVKQAQKYGTGVQGNFVGALSPGGTQQEVINEPPGTYVIFCAMNAEDGRDHYQLGMYRTIRIVK